MQFALDHFRTPEPQPDQITQTIDKIRDQYGIDLNFCDEVSRNLILDFALHGASAAMMNLLQREQTKQLGMASEFAPETDLEIDPSLLIEA